MVSPSSSGTCGGRAHPSACGRIIVRATRPGISARSLTGLPGSHGPMGRWQDSGLPIALILQTGWRYAIDFQATTGTRNRWMTNNTGDDVVYGDRGTADRRLLAYTSEPLAEDVEITGQPVVALHVTSTHTDGAFLVHFEEVAPDGYVRYLTGGSCVHSIDESLPTSPRTACSDRITPSNAKMAARSHRARPPRSRSSSCRCRSSYEPVTAFALPSRAPTRIPSGGFRRKARRLSWCTAAPPARRTLPCRS